MEKGLKKKKPLLFGAMVILVVVIALFLAMCGLNARDVNFSFSMSERDVAIEVGDTKLLELVPDDKQSEKLKVNVTWVSSKPSVVTVSKDGEITGVSGGEAKITAIVKYGNREYSVSSIVTIKSPDMEYSTYKVRWFTQKKDRSSYEVKEETFERLVDSKVELSAKEASQGLPSNYTLNTEQSILQGTVRKEKGACVIEVYHDVAEITYYVDYYYESDTALGTYPTKETKKLKAYAFTAVSVPSNEKTGFIRNEKAKGSVLTNASVVSGSRLKAYYDRVRSQVSISYISDKKDAKYTCVYGVGLIDAPASALKDSLEPFHLTTWVNDEKKNVDKAFMKTLTANTTVEFRVDAVGFNYIDEKGGTLLNTCGKRNTDSYTYLDGSSKTVYLSATYDTTGSQSNMFGITIQSGGTSRELRFQHQGVAVMKDHTTKGGTLNEKNPIYAYNTAGAKAGDAYIWAQNTNGIGGKSVYSAVNSMIKNKYETSNDIIWAIYEGVLYCSVNEEVVLRLPLNLLCEKWTADSKYEIGFSAFDGLGTDDELKIRNISVAYGKEAKAKMVTDDEVDTTSVSKMVYEPITGSYMSASVAGAAYLYGTEKTGDSGITADVNWVNKDNTNSAVGITIQVGEKSLQYIVEGMNTQVRHQADHKWSEVTYIQKQVKAITNPFNDDGTSRVSAYVKDGYFYLTYNDVQVICANMLSIFPEYTKESKVSFGLYTWDANNGLAQFQNVKPLSEKDVKKATLNQWGYYSESQTIDKYDFETATIEKTTSGWKTVKFLGASDIWQVEGTIKRTDTQTDKDLMIGFEVSDGENSIWILGQSKGFAKIVNNSWDNTGNTLYKYNGANTIYSFNDISEDLFVVPRTVNELSFRAVIYQDVFYMWFEDELCWRIPLTDSEFGKFAKGSDYTLSAKFADADRTAQMSDLDVKMSYQVTGQEEFISYKGEAYNFTDTIAKVDANVLRWSDFKAKHITGVMAEDIETSTTGSYEIYAYLKEASTDVYLSSTYTTLEEKATNLFGISIKSGDTSRELRFQSQGLSVMSDNKWSYSGIPGATSVYYYNTAGNHGPYIFAQNTAGAWGKAKQSSVNEMITSKTPSSYKLEWAITEGTLYGRLDGEVFAVLPLTKLCDTWTADNEYQIGISQWDSKANGDIKNTNIVALYGDDAKVKLVTDKKVSATEILDFAYEAFTGSYLPRSTSGAKYIYNVATTEVQGVQATITIIDKNNTGSSSGITIKSGTQSAQIVVEGNNLNYRAQFNHSWGTPTVISNLIPNDAKAYNNDGVYQVTAVAKNNTLYILYNGKQAGSIELYKLLPGYKSGDAVQLGIYGWDSSNGLSKFSDVKFLSTEEATKIAITDYKWNVAFFTQATSNADVNAINGTVANNSNSAMYTTFLGQSTTWEVSGYFERTDSKTDGMQQGFRISVGDKVLNICGQSKGMALSGTGISGISYNYNNATKEDNLMAFNVDTSKFFAGDRTTNKISFKAIIANDILYVWFDGVPTWRVPLASEIKTRDGKTTLFSGFTQGSAYNFSLYIPSTSNLRGNFNTLTVKTGTAVDVTAIQAVEAVYNQKKGN